MNNMTEVIEHLRAMQPLMKEMGDALERFAEEDVEHSGKDAEHDLPTSPFARMNHLRATGRGV